MNDVELEAIADVVVELVKDAIAPLQERIASLEARPTQKDSGVWRPGMLFRAGDLTTYKNDGWIARVDHVAGSAFSLEKFRLWDRSKRKNDDDR